MKIITPKKGDLFKTEDRSGFVNPRDFEGLGLITNIGWFRDHDGEARFGLKVYWVISKKYQNVPWSQCYSYSLTPAGNRKRKGGKFVWLNKHISLDENNVWTFHLKEGDCPIREKMVSSKKRWASW